MSGTWIVRAIDAQGVMNARLGILDEYVPEVKSFVDDRIEYHGLKGLEIVVILEQQ